MLMRSQQTDPFDKGVLGLEKAYGLTAGHAGREETSFLPA
jgi:hypothetical protein